MSGPSCCISVPSLFRNVLTKDQVSKKGFFSSFGHISGPFWTIWSILANMVQLGPCLVHLTAFLFHFCSEMCPGKIKPGKGFCPFLIRLGPRLVRFGPYGLFRTMIGPSCRIAVSFMFRNVQRQDQVSIGSFVYTFCNFHYLCAPFDPFWSIFGPLGPNYETI